MQNRLDMRNSPAEQAGAIQVFGNRMATLNLRHSVSGPMQRQVRGVEIFCTGTHRDQEWSEDDLDEIVKNFDLLSSGDDPEIDVPIVIGHEEEQPLLDNTGIPALGWVRNVRKVPAPGTKDNIQAGKTASIVADFVEVPETIAKLIDGGAYRHVSAEIYDDYTDPAGTHHGKVLRRVAILGGELPQIKNLADLPLTEYAEKQRTTIITFLREESAMPKTKIKRIKKYAEEEVPTETPAPDAVSREELLAGIGEFGLDLGILGELTDAQLAEILRGLRMAAESAEIEGDETAMADQDQEKEKPQDGIAASDSVGPPIAAAQPAPASPKKVTLQYAEVTKRIREAEKKIAATENVIAKRLAQEKKAAIAAFCERMIREGKVLPAEVEAGLMDRLMRQDAVSKFADGKTELDRQMSEIEARPVLVAFAERVKGGGSINTDAETAKVQRFAERFSDADFQRLGNTKNGYIEAFRRARERNPQLTAREYCGVEV